MVETELSLEVLVNSFSSPALHDEANELLLRSYADRGQEVVGWLRLSVAPFNQQPEVLAVAGLPFGGRGVVIIGWDHSPHGESRGEILLRPLAPSAAAESLALMELRRKLTDADCISAWIFVFVQPPHCGLRVDA